jgi:hypothetical protein
MNARAPFRLAFREEGQWVNCYFAKEGTMDGAILMASVLKNVLTVQRWDEYCAMMQAALGELMTDVAGVDAIDFIAEPAAEHERSGQA